MSAEDNNEKSPSNILLTVDTVLALPLVKLVGVCAALLTAGWFAKDYANRLESATSKIGMSVDRIANDLSQFRVEIRRDLDVRTSDRYTRTDHRLWSYELEKQNVGKITVPGIAGLPDIRNEQVKD